MLDDLTEPVVLGLLLLVAVAGACALLYRGHLRRDALRSMSAPSQWPITARELVAPDEHEVWPWLRGVFADYHVMLKIPLARYTAPTTPAESKVWHKRLSGVYCTFTVCGADGTVIGCVDVVGAGDSDRAHWYVKESVLGKCGIPYVMVSCGKLPTGESLRAAFIGQIELSGTDTNDPLALEALAGSGALELTAADPMDAAPIKPAHEHLHASLEQQRRPRVFPPAGVINS
ncbi:DUF2726 domain-containing protein [Polaromonas sp.]|uniref:DUF2726 domain-containing protein n=1 Tax=Polaromonas sp. TaxID=1869339 RepID=UPI0024884C7B|nr:DUF2726 domain-containing protein [Polaromonas sp.]MDI1340795.1 hypothetical protein [Polaromonas sp.]